IYFELFPAKTNLIDGEGQRGQIMLDRRCGELREHGSRRLKFRLSFVQVIQFEIVVAGQAVTQNEMSRTELRRRFVDSGHRLIERPVALVRAGYAPHDGGADKQECCDTSDGE